MRCAASLGRPPVLPPTGPHRLFQPPRLVGCGRLYPGRGPLLPCPASYAPIDAAMLRQYGVFGRIGAFGVDLDSPRGARRFLRVGTEILSAPITPVGHRTRTVRRRARASARAQARRRASRRTPPAALYFRLPSNTASGRSAVRRPSSAFGQPMRGRDLVDSAPGPPASPRRRAHRNPRPSERRRAKPRPPRFGPCSKAAPGSAASMTDGGGCSGPVRRTPPSRSLA